MFGHAYLCLEGAGESTITRGGVVDYYTLRGVVVVRIQAKQK